MFCETNFNKFNKSSFWWKLADIKRNIVNLEISRGPHTLGKPWHKVNKAFVAHQQCASTNALGRFSV